jgi:hypothetical protein
MDSSCNLRRFAQLYGLSQQPFYYDRDFCTFTATIFLEFWKRRQAIHQYDWDITADDEELRVRPEYAIKLKHHRKNPVTQVRQ